ncbi:uncharacterized protein CTHT_0014550 [Thermochaetoides thermophila DSM 1495]|uniref:DUF8035 domain-containing protein n=1 Tax=Chaetomium thermophilum (strain DSM 1495 / CBS 144.50 / IMI 039719) TaxID=759272 RepID=G0S1R6_CHATD|nr:hypothetical protein CTHT_0014550 [Thermochaetoides thermophila DSM 1495]EGS22976.1 hypothetical protein CTHT_0014550 [Thermochaetoides thermophila DSM 1495]
MSARSRVDEYGYIREPRRAREYEERRYEIRERSRSRDRVPYFLREENRRPEQGPLVLREREREIVERPVRGRSPTPVRVHERVIERTRSVTPPPRPPSRRDGREEVRIRQVVRESSRGPGPERIRFIDSHSRSPSPVERERIRIVEKERAPNPPPSPRPTTPQVIQGPIIERQVITHYRDIDHGIVPAHPPSPLREHRDTEIEIHTSRGGTEVGIHRARSRSRVRGRSIERPVIRVDDDASVRVDRKHLHVDIERRRSLSRTGGRRAHSAAPPIIDHSSSSSDEEYEITSRIGARSRPGEAIGGSTRNWTIIDVPPGTERVRMDGAGGASAEVTWSKYSGVRRTRWIPDRDEEKDKDSIVSSTTTTTTVSERERGRVRSRSRDRRVSVSINLDKNDDRRELEVEKVTDRRIVRASSTNPPAKRQPETWTEITKDLVCREAIEQLGYEYEETDWFYYIVEYLSYDEVCQLVDLSDRIRAERQQRARELAWERGEWRPVDDWDLYYYRDHEDRHRGRDRHSRRHHHKYRYASSTVDYDDDGDSRVVEREVVYDSHRSRSRGYRH